MPPAYTRKILWKNWYEFNRTAQSFRPIVAVRNITQGSFYTNGFFIGQHSRVNGVTPSGSFKQSFLSQGIVEALSQYYQYPAVGAQYIPNVITDVIDGNFAWKYSFDNILPTLQDYSPSAFISSQTYKPALSIQFARNTDVQYSSQDGYYLITGITEPTYYPSFEWKYTSALGEATMQGTTLANGYALFNLGGKGFHSSTSETAVLENEIIGRLDIDTDTDTIIGTYKSSARYSLSNNGFEFF